MPNRHVDEEDRKKNTYLHVTHAHKHNTNTPTLAHTQTPSTNTQTHTQIKRKYVCRIMSLAVLYSVELAVPISEYIWSIGLLVS